METNEVKMNDDSEKNKFLSFLGGKAGRILLTCIFGILFLLVIALISDSGNGILLLIMAVPCTYFGLQVTGRIPNFLSSLPLGDWWFLIFKVLLSIAIGIFVGPFWLGKKTSNKVAEYIKAIKK